MAEVDRSYLGLIARSLGLQRCLKTDRVGCKVREKCTTPYNIHVGSRMDLWCPRPVAVLVSS